MKTAKSLSELKAILQTGDYIKGNAKISKKMTVATEMLLRAEGERLKKCINDKLEDFYNRTPSPSGRYQRTENLKKSLMISDVEIISSGEEMRISVYFDDTLATSVSLWEGGDSVNKADVIQGGWQVKKEAWFSDIYMFGYYEGSNFILDGIAEWEKDIPEGMALTTYNVRPARGKSG